MARVTSLLFLGLVVGSSNLMAARAPRLDWSLPLQTLFTGKAVSVTTQAITKSGEPLLLVNHTLIGLTNTGTVAFRHAIPSEAESDFDGLASIMLDDAGNIIVAADKGVTKLTNEGKDIWQFQAPGLGGYMQTGFFANSDPMMLGYSESADLDTYLIRLDATTGKPIWNVVPHTRDGKPVLVLKAVADSKGNVLGYGYVGGSAPLLFRVNGSDGSLMWEHQYPASKYVPGEYFSLSPNGRYALYSRGVLTIGSHEDPGAPPPSFSRIEFNDEGEGVVLQKNLALDKGDPIWSSINDKGEFWIAIEHSARNTQKDFSIVYKFDAQGDVAWESPTDNDNESEGYSGFVLDSRENLIVSGSGKGPDPKITFHTFELDTMGKKLWDYYFPVPSDYAELDRAKALYDEKSGSLFLLGNAKRYQAPPASDCLVRLSLNRNGNVAEEN